MLLKLLSCLQKFVMSKVSLIPGTRLRKLYVAVCSFVLPVSWSECTLGHFFIEIVSDPSRTGEKTDHVLQISIAPPLKFIRIAWMFFNYVRDTCCCCGQDEDSRGYYADRYQREMEDKL